MIAHFIIKIVARIKYKINFAENVKWCTIEKGTILHTECKILNFQKNKGKIKIGSHTHVRGELMLFGHGGEIEIGEYCYIGEMSKIWSAEKVIIGNRVLISHNVNIHDSNAHPLDKELRHLQYRTIIEKNHPTSDLDLNEKPVVIKNDVWIGFNSIILKGITIGEGAIIAAGSVVTKNVDPYTLVAGNPAIFIKNI